MSCTSHRESLALRLYGELDSAENEALGVHLAVCAACRAFADELERGLGELARPRAAGTTAASADDIPLGWRERLDALPNSSSAPIRGTRVRPLTRWAPAAASLAAGLLLGFGLSLRFDGTAPVASDQASANPAARFERATPPPRATSRGELDQLARYLAR